MDKKIVARFEEIAEMAGGTVRCPVCDKDEWTFQKDAIFDITGLSIRRHRRLEGEDAGEVEHEAVPSEDSRPAHFGQ